MDSHGSHLKRAQGSVVYSGDTDSSKQDVMALMKDRLAVPFDYSSSWYQTITATFIGAFWDPFGPFHAELYHLFPSARGTHQISAYSYLLGIQK